MMVENHYELNLSKAGHHVCKVDVPSISSLEQAANLCGEFIKRFPQSEGYQVDMYRIHCYGEPILSHI